MAEDLREIQEKEAQYQTLQNQVFRGEYFHTKAQQKPPQYMMSKDFLTSTNRGNRDEANAMRKEISQGYNSNPSIQTAREVLRQETFGGPEKKRYVENLEVMQSLLMKSLRDKEIQRNNKNGTATYPNSF